MTASRIPGLDALRGLAALLVLGYHARTVAPLAAIWPPVALGHGYLAVDLFFVISGFVLARAYDERLTAGEGGAFMVRRLKRLYPMALLGLLLGAAICLGQGKDPVSVMLLLALGLVFAPFTGGRDVFPLNGPQWSLMWELLANLAYALVAPWLTTRRLIGLVLVAGVAHAGLVLSHGTGSLGPYAQDGWAGAPRVVFGFFAGVLLARQRFKVPDAPIAVLLALVVLTLSPPVPEFARGVFDLVAALAVFPLVVASAAGAEVGVLRPLLDRLAGLSYALYALHIPIVLGLAHWGLGALAIPAALVAAWAAHRWFEPWAASLLARKPQGFSTSLPSSSTR
ncbi:acyltransferase [uncultured Caulobacter sp.]|uniref:acyltransferase family protein n=1 Tax=uncultured Caulobacter sp. TaxID=158749 RepID=UPI00260609ED|nr:acyltransferase [uncultured Caulobacter sp.]